MQILNAFRKSIVLNLATGFCFGIIITLISIKQMPTRYSSFVYIPRNLDKHEEIDTNSNIHASESNTESHILYNKVRVLCLITTQPKNIQMKAVHIKATWGRRCNVLLFMSSAYDAELPAIALNVTEGRIKLWAKTKAAFKYVFDHHLNDADWFYKADDDTYAVMENLRFFLRDISPSQPVYYGRKFKISAVYMSGGAGYVLSKEAVIRVVRQGFVNSSKCVKDDKEYEDLEMGSCLSNVGVEAGDSRDELGRERFHPFKPESHLIPGQLSKNAWYMNCSYYSIKQGPDCCSDYTISFHHVEPNMLHVLEYLIYHLKPYGINTVVANNAHVYPIEKKDKSN